MRVITHAIIHWLKGSTAKRSIPAHGMRFRPQTGCTSCARNTAGPQAELASRIGADAGQISRYENGRITPSLDATIRIAQALNISLDYLAIDDIPRRPLHIDDHGLSERLALLSELDDEDRTSLLRVLDAMLTRKRLHTLANNS